MKIERFEYMRWAIPYRKPFVIAGGPSAVADHVLIRLTSDDGVVGYGEAAPMSSYSEESAEDIIPVLVTYLARAVIGRDPRDLEAIHEAMNAAIPGHSIAKAAIDFALYDLLGKSLGVPANAFLGGIYRDRVPLAWVEGLGDIDEIVAGAHHAVRLGFRTVKLKIGRDPKRDLEMVREVRNAVGPDVKIRVDGNQGYDFNTAIRTLRKMEVYELELIEQPLPRWNYDGLARLAEALDTPIMADESMFSPEDAINLVRGRVCDIINIKIVKPGGLYNSKKVLAIAEAAGVPCLVGSMIEFGIGTAAGLHFAASGKNIKHACEFIGPLMLKDDVVAGNIFSIEHVKDGCYVLPDGPGLGVELDEGKLAGGTWIVIEYK